jgi:hypothetical protein
LVSLKEILTLKELDKKLLSKNLSVYLKSFKDSIGTSKYIFELGFNKNKKKGILFSINKKCKNFVI